MGARHVACLSSETYAVGMTFTQALAQEIRAELARRQVSRSELIRRMQATATNLPSRASIHRMIRGELTWDVHTLDAAALALGVALPDLLSRADAVYRWNLPSVPRQRKPQVTSCPMPL